MENIFSNPKEYLDEIKNKQIMKINNQIRHTKKSVVVVFLTRFCSAECPFCIYKSKKKWNISVEKEENEFSNIGTEKCINLINNIDTGYLLIAGGGEPLEKIDHVYKMLKEANADRIVIATNGFWGKEYNEANNIIKEIKQILGTKVKKAKFVLRISIDRWHLKAIGEESIENIVNAYKNNVTQEDNFYLEFHTIIGDESLNNLISKWNACLEIYESNNYISDNTIVSKNSKKRGKIIFNDGLEIQVGYAKLFYPNLLVDINKKNDIMLKAIKTFYEDIEESQEGNFSTVDVSDSGYGLDWLVNFNGNVNTWGNYQLENIPNIYSDTYSEIVNKLYDDIISYSYINIPLREREKIVNEISPEAVIRASAINVRDYSGAYLLFEEKTALYYSIRIIQKFIKEEKISYEDISCLPDILIDAIKLDIEELKIMYNLSNYTIIDQYIRSNKTTLEDLGDLLFLIYKGHFVVRDQDLKKLFDFCKDKGIETEKELMDLGKENRYIRLINKMTSMPSD